MPTAETALTLDIGGRLVQFTQDALILAAVCLLVGGLIGWLMAYLVHQKRLVSMRTRLGIEHAATAQALDDMEQRFAALSLKALQQNHQVFMNLAIQSFGKYQNIAENSLLQREQAMANLVQPIREALDKTERQVQLMEKARSQAYGALSEQIKALAESQQMLQGETRNLVTALRRPEVRGQWGEITLKRLVELAGMKDHCDYYEQEHTATEDGAMRPDMIVRMPGSREVVIDVKTPLDAYLSAVEAPDDIQRKHHLHRHAVNVRERVRELSTKAYWSQFSNAPDFVVLFIPGDQFLSAALDDDRNLLEKAMEHKVILATPTSLMALLRAIAYGWRQELLTENAEEIRQLGENMYLRLATFSEHLGRLGRSLEASVNHFNKAVGSFQRQLVPGAEKFTAMGIKANKEVEAPEQIEKTPSQAVKHTNNDR
jgi:DNA recombination protein RmuC